MNSDAITVTCKWSFPLMFSTKTCEDGNFLVIKLITKKIPSSQVFVENLKGNDHLQVTVIASEFNGLSLVKQHQLVYSALKEELASEAIHALALKTETPN